MTDWTTIAVTQARASTAPAASGAGLTAIYVEYPELAAYNAVVAIQGGFQPYKYTVPAPAGASADAAVIEAFYRVLKYLLPDRGAALDAAYSTSLAAIPDGEAKTDGEAVGLSSANSLISVRVGDGRGLIWHYTYPSVPTPGVWMLTPGATAPSAPWVGQMRPFTFDDPSQYLPDEPPPALTSKTWADDYNETKSLGAVNSATRTPKQTEVGLFWTDHTTAQYARMLNLLAMEENLNLLNSARLMASSFSALADGAIGCWNAKYHYSFWRPVTAIRNGDIDGNPNTIADPGWIPLAVTPAHPEYSAAHGCLTGALVDTLKSYFGTPHIHLTVSSAVTNTTHHFNSVEELEHEVERARIYAGFHFHHSLVQGFVLGHKVSHHVTHHYFEPVKNEHHREDDGDRDDHDSHHHE